MPEHDRRIGRAAGHGDPPRAADNRAEDEVFRGRRASGGAAYDDSAVDDLAAEVELDEETLEAEVIEEAAEAVAALATDEERIAELEAEVAVWKDATARKQAEFENFRKRTTREQEEFKVRAIESVVADLLPALDNLDRAIEHVAGGGDAAKLVTGVQMTGQQIHDILSKYGVVVIDPAGAPFDPNEHQAVGQREDVSVPDHTVVEVYLKGYRLGSRVVRPASVVVATGGPAQAG